MAIAVQNIYTNSQASGGSSGAFSLAATSVAATGTCLAVAVVSSNFGADNVTGITYDGNAMTKVISVQPTIDQPNATIYYLAVSSGSGKTVTASFNGGGDRTAIIAVYILTGANTSSPIDASVRNGNTSTNSTTTVTTTVNNCMVIDCIARASTATPSVSGANTLGFTAQGHGTSYQIQPTAGGTTNSWTSTSTGWGSVGVSIAPSADVAAITAGFLLNFV